MLDQIFHLVTDIGLWRGAKRNSIHFIAKFFILCFLGVFILQLVALVLARDNLEKLFECSSVTFVCGMAIIKIFSLHLNGPTWITLIKKMNQLEKEESQNSSVFEYDSDDDEQPTLEYAKLKKKYEDEFRFTFEILRRIHVVSLVLFIASPFIEYGFRSLLSDRPSNYPHIILPAWMPLDNGHVACYIVMVISEAVAAICCTCVTIAYDLTFIGIITFICGQYSILFDQCTRIGGRGCNRVVSRKRDERAHSRIRYSHKTYISLVNITSTLDSLCKNTFGVYFLISTVTLCCIVLRLKLETLSIMQMARLSQYASVILIQLYLFCTYGDKVLNTSSINMGEGPFCATIWCLGPKIRREIVMLSIGMSQLRRLRAGPFNTMDLPSFLQIVRAAYSCYAVVGQKK